jgi:hypothetical protein
MSRPLSLFLWVGMMFRLSGVPSVRRNVFGKLGRMSRSRGLAPCLRASGLEQRKPGKVSAQGDFA